MTFRKKEYLEKKKSKQIKRKKPAYEKKLQLP